MEFFIDTADVEEIKRGMELGLVDGVTTNPSLVAKTGRTFEEVCKEIVGLGSFPVSVEAISLDAEGMIAEGRKFAKWGENVVVKIPMTLEGMKAVRVFTEEGIKTNVTLVFSPLQALMAAKAGATYVSPFLGRLDDASHQSSDLIEQILQIYENFGFKTRLIAASVRHMGHILDSALSGCDIATIPLSVLEKMVYHPLTDKGIKAFLDDYKKIPGK